MNDLEKVISQMDFQYFGTGQHKIEPEEFFRKEGAILLDVRAPEEMATIKLKMEHHCQVLEIPTNEAPKRLNEIPTDKFIGIFCSSGVRCTVIFAYLKSKGYEHVRILPGGYAPFMDAVLPGKIFKIINS